MQAFCRVSSALKLAVFCLFVGVIVGVWLSTSMGATESQPQPTRAPTTQVADAPSGQPE